MADPWNDLAEATAELDRLSDKLNERIKALQADLAKVGVSGCVTFTVDLKEWIVFWRPREKQLWASVKGGGAAEPLLSAPRIIRLETLRRIGELLDQLRLNTVAFADDLREVLGEVLDERRKS